MEQRDKLTVEECRQLLGADAEGWTNERIERLRDRLEALAEELYPVIGRRPENDLEGIRWAIHAHQHGLDRDDLAKDAGFDHDDTEVGPCPVQ